MVLKTMAAATDEAVTPISTAGKKWDTTTLLAWINKNKNKNKHQNKINNSGSNVTASMPADSYAHAAASAAFA